MKRKPILLFAISLSLLSGCSRDELPQNMNITKDPSTQIEYELFENDVISLEKPINFEISIYPTDDSHYTFKVYDKEDENTLLFFNLKSDGFTKTIAERNEYIKNNPDSKEAKLPVLENTTTTSYFNIWNEVASSNELTAFKIPKFKDATINEIILKEDEKEILAFNYEDSKGIFTANIKDNNEVYDTIFLISSNEKFINYEEILNHILKTLKFKKDDTSYEELAKKIHDAYLSRSTDEEIEYQKQMDINKHIKRIKDTKTENIYKTVDVFFFIFF